MEGVLQPVALADSEAFPDHTLIHQQRMVLHWRGELKAKLCPVGG